MLPPKRGPKSEPVSPNLVASLVHPDRKAYVTHLAFSPDGARLFGSGYPSGIIQIWDVASRKEVHRIDTPPGYRGSSEYAQFAPDWKTLYVPVERRTVTAFERDGKRLQRIDYAGQIRVFDVASGKERDPLVPAPGSAPHFARLAPGGRLLLCVERASWETTQRLGKDTTVVWDLEARKKWKLCDGFAVPAFAPDGKTVAVTVRDHEANTSEVRTLDLMTGKELAALRCPERERQFSAEAVSPDGAVVAVAVGGKKGAPVEVWFRDARTLEDRGKLIGKGNPRRYGWGAGKFTPDGKRYVALDGAGNVLVWDVAGRKLERTLPVSVSEPTDRLVISPDGRTAAIEWLPKLDAELAGVRDPDPRDLPQYRITLVDLTGKAGPRTLIGPHGYAGAPAFSPDGRTLAVGSAGAVHLFDLTK